MDKSLARDRIGYARKRLNEFLALGDQVSALPFERQQLIQEFFWHCASAIEMVAQLVNDARTLGIAGDDVTVPAVVAKLPAGDPVRLLLASSHANPRRDPMPADPYSDEGYVWRLWNYRHQVSHRGRNPFDFGGAPSVAIRLDPRNPALGASAKTAQEELQGILDLVEDRCEKVLAEFP